MVHKFDVVSSYSQALHKYGSATDKGVEDECQDFERVLNGIENDIVRQTLINEIRLWDVVDLQVGVPYLIRTIDALQLGQRLAREP